MTRSKVRNTANVRKANQTLRHMVVGLSSSPNVKGDSRLVKDYASKRAKWKRIFSRLSTEEMLAICDAIVPESFDKHICETLLSPSISQEECQNFHDYMRTNGYDREVSYRLYVWWKFWKYWSKVSADSAATNNPFTKGKNDVT
jgi:hypothetical protein